MLYKIHFKRGLKIPTDNVLLTDNRLKILASFFDDDLQHINSVEETGYYEWLTDDAKQQKSGCGNCCCLSEIGDMIEIRHMFADIIKVRVKKQELIFSIQEWVIFCNNFTERVVEFTDIQFI